MTIDLTVVTLKHKPRAHFAHDLDFSVDTNQKLRVFLKDKLDTSPDSYIIRTSAPGSVCFPLVCTNPHSLKVMYRSDGISSESEDLAVDQLDTVFPIVQLPGLYIETLPSIDSNRYIIVEELQSDPVRAPSNKKISVVAKSAVQCASVMTDTHFYTHYLTPEVRFFPSVSLFSRELLVLNNSLRLLIRSDPCLDSDLLAYARSIMIAASSFPTDEKRYQKLLQEYLCGALRRAVTFGHGTDACVVDQHKGFLFLLGEVKRDQEAGDSLTQVMLNYSIFWDCKSGIFSEIATQTYCPAILVEIRGHFFSVYGAVMVYKDGDYHKYVEHFATVSLLYNRHSHYDLHFFANILLRVRDCLNKLQDYYNVHVSEIRSNATSQTAVSFDRSIISFPVFGIERFKYLQLISPLTPVYLANYKTVDQKPLVVKFATTYDVEAHKLLAEHGFAPDFYYYEEISNQLTLIEMEYLDPAEFCLLESIPYSLWGRKQDILKEIRNAVNLLNSHNIVHGDLRPSNIFVSKSTCVIKIFDFDFAGLADRSNMCVFVNEEVVFRKPFEKLNLQMNDDDFDRIEEFLSG
ncbi:hypothetical protein GEMRC1_013949 [Eukaryota sp. GEM-RC1]